MEQLIKRVHDKTLLRGKQKLYNDVQATVRKENLDIRVTGKDIDAWLDSNVRNSQFALRRQAKTKRPNAVSEPYHTWSGDLIDFGYAKTSSKEFKNVSFNTTRHAYTLVCVDAFTKKVYTANMKTKGAIDLKAALENVFADHPPNVLIFDDESAMRSEVVQSYLATTGTRLKQVAGQKANHAESIIRVLKNYMVESMTRGSKNFGRWESHLSKAVKNWNSTVHSVTNFEPNELTVAKPGLKNVKDMTDLERKQFGRYIIARHNLRKNWRKLWKKHKQLKSLDIKAGDRVRVDVKALSNAQNYRKSSQPSYSSAKFVVARTSPRGVYLEGKSAPVPYSSLIFSDSK